MQQLAGDLRVPHRADHGFASRWNRLFGRRRIWCRGFDGSGRLVLDLERGDGRGREIRVDGGDGSHLAYIGDVVLLLAGEVYRFGRSENIWRHRSDPLITFQVPSDSAQCSQGSEGGFELFL